MGNHKNEGHGVNDNTGYSGNTNVGGVTDSKGNPLQGEPRAIFRQLIGNAFILLVLKSILAVYAGLVIGIVCQC